MASTGDDDKAYADRKAVLSGTLDVTNELSMLRGNALVWQSIFDRTDDLYCKHVCVDRTQPPFLVKPSLDWSVTWGDNVKFPEPTGININMMPVKYWNLKETLPDYLMGYKGLIQQCPVLPSFSPETYERKDHIVYLSVHESLVPVGQSQRRPGLHIERPIRVDGRVLPYDTTFGSEYHNACWGLGYSDPDGHPVNGIFMASTVDDSCALWPVLIDEPEGVTDAHGSIEHMRSYLLRSGVLPVKLKANSMAWITDRTPHESLPVHSPEGREAVYRQWFRLVVGPISTWYAKNNTPNPLGVLPDAPISDEDRFA